jgi:hypothetical protein
MRWTYDESGIYEVSVRTPKVQESELPHARGTGTDAIDMIKCGGRGPR